jgi:hypothetical protein
MPALPEPEAEAPVFPLFEPPPPFPAVPFAEDPFVAAEEDE